MAYIASATPFNSGTGAVTSFTLTCPTGTVASSTVYIFAHTATSTAAGHTATGFTAVGLNGQTISTSSKHTILEATGHTAGDVITVNCPASGISAGIMEVYDSTTTRDGIGTVATSGSPASETVPALTTTQATELVLCFSVGLFTAARTVSSVTPANTGATRDTLGAGGNTRWFAIEASDQVVPSAGTSGNVTVLHSGTLTGFTGMLISHKLAPPVGTITANATAGQTLGGTVVGTAFTGWGVPL